MRHMQRLSVNASSIELHDVPQGKRLWSCKWDDVKEIVAWKDDLYTCDLICIGFKVTGRADCLRVDEEAGGGRCCCRRCRSVMQSIPTTGGLRWRFPRFERIGPCCGASD